MFVGLDNYIEVFTQPVLKLTGFWQLFAQTVLWTSINVFFHVSLGMALALLLHRKMRGKGIYRALIILPWAVPQIIALLIWRTEYNYEYGAVNQLLGLIGLGPFPWLSEPVLELHGDGHHERLARRPVHDGDHPRRPAEHLERLLRGRRDRRRDAAASRSARITLPLLRPVLTPAIILGTVWTFNNINVPFFINQNELETSDILVTALFRAGLPVQPLR